MGHYGKGFFDRIEKGSVGSAEIILPIVFETLKPRALLDVGCGNGSWLSVAKRLGVNQIKGCDGPWVTPDQLLIEPGDFMPIDFERPGSGPSGSFDLAMSLEVLEHISDAAGKRVIAYMAERAPVVLFSAAVPGQGGRNHINEQWQSYWAAEFRKHGFEPWDIIRSRIWKNAEIKPWYRQNIILYVHPRSGLSRPVPPPMPIDVINPDLFTPRIDKLNKYKERAEGTFGGRIRSAVRKLRNR